MHSIHHSWSRFGGERANARTDLIVDVLLRLRAIGEGECPTDRMTVEPIAASELTGPIRPAS